MNIRIPLVSVVLVSAFIGASAQTTINVPADYPTIQQAIDASADGDTILVAPGIYYERLDFGSHQVTVRSTDGAQTTIIDGSFIGPVITFGSAATRQAVLQGFTITHGQAERIAGGIAVSEGSPTIRSNIVQGNLGGPSGNGISLYLSSALVVGNIVMQNENVGADSGGGGGGGIGITGDPCGNTSCGAEIIDNLITQNTVDHFIFGGGIYVDAGYVKIIGNTISNNSVVGLGGGISMVNCVDAQIENNLIAGNSATARGGGIYMSVLNGPHGPSIINNTIVDNGALAGSAIYTDGFAMPSRIVNNVLVATPGITALECDISYSTHPPTLIANDAFVSDGAVAYSGACTSAVGTNGNISEQPIFIPGSYRLAFGSPGIDAGMNAFSTQSTDILGGPRMSDGNLDGAKIIDMGAYEWADAVFANGFGR